jgi:hypothetical protein
VRAFVQGVLPDAPAGLTDSAYLLQRESDLCALLYRWLSGRCRAPKDGLLTLASLRMAFDGAVLAEAKDHVFLAGMFAYSGDDDAIFHDGLVLRNSEGKNVAGLVTYLDTHGAPGFSQLHPRYKEALIRRKLYALDEYAGNYRLDSVMQAMATIMMRTSLQPAPNRYIVYRDRMHLEECWGQRTQEQIAQGHMPYGLEIYKALYLEHAGKLKERSIKWYRASYLKIVQAIEASDFCRTRNADAQQPMWQWLSKHMPGWQASTRSFGAVSTQRYQTSIVNMADVLYQIGQASHLPVYVRTDMLTGLGYTKFHPLLDGLPFDIQKVLSQIARQFDVEPFRVEHILSDTPLDTIRRVMENCFYRTALALRSEPFWTVEVEAYRILLTHNMTFEQMTEGQGNIYSNVQTDAWYQRPRPLYDAFIAVIRNTDKNALLILPNGKAIKPCQIVKKSFDAYNRSIEKHPWVVGRARQNLRDRGLPFLPSILRAEIKAIAAPLRVIAISTESGTQRADDFLGMLPIAAPLLKLARAVRDKQHRHIAYYMLLVARDVLGTAAMVKMLSAAYISPFIFGMRYSSAGLLTLKMLPARSFRRFQNRQPDFVDVKPVLRKQGKANDVTLTGDQTRGLQTKVNRAKTGGNVARQYSNDPRFDNGSYTNTDDAIDPDVWYTMMRLMLPSLEDELARQQQRILKTSGGNRQPQPGMTAGDDDGDDDVVVVQAVLPGFTDADAFTLCGTQILDQRETVQEAIEWMFKATDDERYEGRPVDDNIQVIYADGVAAAWNHRPDWRYAPSKIITRYFNDSALLRRLFNWVDNQPIELQSLQITVDIECRHATLTVSEVSAEIRLPADPGRLPFIVNDMHVNRQSIESAIIENIVAAITRNPAPQDPERERGVNIWLANHVRLQADTLFEPRASAASFNRLEQARNAENKETRRAAELEDQYLERINPESPIDVRRHRFPAIAKRPTVRAVLALMKHIGYAAFLERMHAENQTGAKNLKSYPGFKDRFQHIFTVDTSSRNTMDATTVHAFLDACNKSSLFQRLADFGHERLVRLKQHWLILPNGFAGDGRPDEDILVPSEGIINAGTDKALCLVLIGTEPHPTNESVSLPLPSVQALEPARRILDGVIAAFLGDYATPTRETAFHHRGPIVWASDLVLLQAGFPAKPRLVGIAVSSQHADDSKRLVRMAAQKRHMMRDEDAFLEDFFANAST